MTRVSVIIPAYNAEEYLAETLDSVVAQSFRDIEVVLVDDGSTDGTIALAEGYANRLNLTILRQRSGGPAAARNTGIRQSRGAYCAFIDSDDLMLPQRIAEQCAALDADPEVGLAHTDLMTFDHSGVIHVTRRAFSAPVGGHILPTLLLDNSITTSTVMARRSCLLEAGLFDDSLRISEDFDLWLRMAERWKVAYVDKPLVKYRRRPGSASEDKVKTGLAALKVVEKFWESHGEFAASHSALRRRSLARHLAVAGDAAQQQGRFAVATRLLCRALSQSPADTGAWKSLLKTVIGAARGARA